MEQDLNFIFYVKMKVLSRTYFRYHKIRHLHTFKLVILIFCSYLCLQKEYSRLHPRGELPVKANDAMFSINAVSMNIIVIIQCLVFERGDQKVCPFLIVIVVIYPMCQCKTISWKLIDWWLMESHLSGWFCFFTPKFWECGGSLRMIFCQSGSAVSVVSIL